MTDELTYGEVWRDTKDGEIVMVIGPNWLLILVQFITGTVAEEDAQFAIRSGSYASPFNPDENWERVE
jgi:hypothetical protein